MAVEVSDFEKEVMARSREIPVVVDFWAPWCGPCRTLGPLLDKLEREAGGAWELAKVDVDDHQALAGQLGIQGIPEVRLIHGERALAAFAGALPEGELRHWLNKHLPGPEQNALADIKRLIEGGDTTAAKVALEKLAAAGEGGEATFLLLARLLVWDEPARALLLLDKIHHLGDFGEPAQKLRPLAEALTASPEDLPDAPRVRDYYAAALEALHASRIEETLDQLLEVIYRDRDYLDDGARKLILAIFDALGSGHPTVKNYNRRLEMALF